jgi:hypothetical protein
MRILLNKGGLCIVEVDGIKWIIAGYLPINLPWLLRHHPEIVGVFPPIKR